MNRGFKTFPKKLYGNTVKMLNVRARAFGMSKPSEIFYSIKDGSWQDVTVWETVSGRVGRIPSANDDVYIKHSITKSTSANCFCYNLFLTENAKLTWDANNNSFVNVYGNIQCKGTLDMAATASFSHFLALYGTRNFIEPTKFIPNANGIVSYRAIVDQPVLDLPYATLEITSPSGNGSAANVINQGTKYLTANLVTTKDLITWGGVIDFGRFDVTINGALNGNQGFVKKTGSGNVLIVGLLTLNNFPIGFDFSNGNPTVELRGGIAIPNSNPPINAILSGTGTWTFTTNNQTINTYQSQFYQTLDCPIIISGAITVTILSTGGLNLNNTLTGNNAASSLVNQGLLYFNTLTAASGFMTTGTHNFTTTLNTVGWTGNYSYTIPEFSYRSIRISGTGTKTLSGNTTLTEALTVASTTGTGLFELSTYNLTVGTTTTMTSGQISKTGTGSVLFIGLVTLSSNGISFTGNPTVECRGGLATVSAPFISGTEGWSFTTNNQFINGNQIGGEIIFSCPVLIVGAITVTLNYVNRFNSTVEGTAVGSVLFNSANANTKLYYSNVMLTFGTFDFTTAGNGVAYFFDGDYTLPSTTYHHLSIGGTGFKSLSGNTTVGGGLNQNLAIGKLQTVGFNLTVTGATTCAIYASGAGNLIFIGNFLSGTVDFSVGNPTVEIRGASNGNTSASYNCGNGLWTLTTNNQTWLGNSIGGTLQFTNVLISGAITITTGTQSFQFIGYLDGNNALSTFDNRGTVNYKSATRPMVTGVLQTNAAANTWIYGLNNQDITGGTYRILTLNGTGVKTLQGNVVVATTYTLTAPATLNLNGFTRT